MKNTDLQMNRSIIHGTLVSVLAAAFCACSNPSGADVAESGIRAGIPVLTQFRLLQPDDPGETKSSYAGADTAVSNYNLLLFDAGTLAAKYYKDSGNAISFEVMADRRYDCYCIANVGDITGRFVVGTTKESLMDTLRVTAPAGGYGLPMAWSESNVGFSKAELNAGARLRIELRRLVAQWDIVVDRQGLDIYSFRVTGLSVRGPSDVTPFSESRAAAAPSLTDRATAGDLVRLNDGQKATFYPLENCCGRLLPDNGDPWNKTPDNVPAGNYPTYIEISGEAVVGDGSQLAIPVTYRFCPGKDATSDFDVQRNTVNTVTLVLSDSSITAAAPSWKVEKGSFNDYRTLALPDGTVDLPGPEEVTVAVTRSPASLRYLAELDASLKSAGVSISGVAAGVPVDLDVLTLTSPSNVSVTDGNLRIRTIDGRRSASVAVEAGRRLSYLSVNTDSPRVLTGGDSCQIRVTANYLGGRQRDVTDEVTWTIADMELLEPLGSGKFKTMMKAGSSRVTASLTESGIQRTVSATVTAYREFLGVRVTPDHVYLPGIPNCYTRSYGQSIGDPNHVYFTLEACFHDGTTEGIRGNWTPAGYYNGGIILRHKDGTFTEDGNPYWRLYGAKIWETRWNPVDILIYVGRTSLLTSEWSLNNDVQRYYYASWARDITSSGSGVILTVSGTYDGHDYSVDIYGTTTE